MRVATEREMRQAGLSYQPLKGRDWSEEAIEERDPAYRLPISNSASTTTDHQATK